MSESSSSYSCNPVFPEGTNADTHYRVKKYKCSEPCDCPVKERPSLRPKGLSYGTVSIQDGVRTNSPTEIYEKEKGGLVRYSEEYVPEIVPKIYNKNQEVGSFSVDVFYRDYKYVYNQGYKFLTTNLQTEYAKSFNRIASSKRLISDVKSFVAQYSGCDEAHKLRKRMIALSKIKDSISNDVFRFGVE